MRFSATRHIPTIAEAGLAGFDVTIWFAILAPAKLPPDLSEVLVKVIATVMEKPGLRARFEEIGA